MIYAYSGCKDIDLDGSCDDGLPLSEIIDASKDHWNTSVTGDVKQYQSFFDPGYKLYINREVDSRNWHQLNLLEYFFSKVNITYMHLETSITPADYNAVLTFVI